MLNSPQNISQEKLTVQEAHQDGYKFDDNPEVQSILSDFDNLNFVKNPCDDPQDTINYNRGKEVNPFDKIAKYYGRNKNVFLFISMLRNKEQLKKVIDKISKKCDVQAKEKFVKRMNTYLARISTGERDAKEFLGSDLDAFFNGYHVPCPGHDRNIHENLNINITKPKQDLETSSFFSRTTKRIKEEKSEVKRVKIYSNNKRIVTIEKNDKQQRNYSFTKEATCKLEISWSTKDESKQGPNCTVVLNINSGQISIGKLIIDGKDVELKEILELAKKNEAVLIEGKALHEVLAESLIKQTPCEKEKSTLSRKNIIVPGFDAPNFALHGGMIVGGVSSPQQKAV